MRPPPEFYCAFVTAPNIAVARKIAASALKDRLIACANIIPKIESHYWWQGQLESSSEVLLLLKTTKEKLASLEQSVVRDHPYDTPEFIVLKLDRGTDKYLSWITASVAARSDATK